MYVYKVMCLVKSLLQKLVVRTNNDLNQILVSYPLTANAQYRYDVSRVHNLREVNLSCGDRVSFQGEIPNRRPSRVPCVE